MSWICPNCSGANDEVQKHCIVCGMDRPAVGSGAGASPEEGKIVFSDLEAFTESVKNLFRPRPSVKKAAKTPADSPRREKTPKPPKPPKEKRLKADKPKAEKPKAEKPKADNPKAGKPVKARVPEGPFASPWPEHAIEFDVSALKAKGYVRSERRCESGVNGYCFYTADGTSRFLRLEMLVLLKLARRNS